MSVDVFGDHLEGLILAEVDGDDAGAATIHPPVLCRPVTTGGLPGGRLARHSSPRECVRRLMTCASDLLRRTLEDIVNGGWTCSIW
jgi:hypothetical protein